MLMSKKIYEKEFAEYKEEIDEQVLNLITKASSLK